MVLGTYAYAFPRAFKTDISQWKYLDRVIKHREKCRNSKPRRSARCIMYEYHTSQSTARGAKRLFLRWRCHAMKLHQLDLRSWTTIWRSLNSASRLGKIIFPYTSNGVCCTNVSYSPEFPEFIGNGQNLEQSFKEYAVWEGDLLNYWLTTCFVSNILCFRY